MTWSSDGSVVKRGFEVCGAHVPPSAPPLPMPGHLNSLTDNRRKLAACPLLPPSPPLHYRRKMPAQPGQVTTITNLRSKLTSQTSEIELAAGHYLLGGTRLSISHDVTIRAAPDSTVILDAGGNSGVFSITSGTVILIGLSITGGDAGNEVCTHWLGTLPKAR